MYNIVFSIPVHEKFDVVLDQIINFKHYNENCAIVIHISQVFDYKNSQISKDVFLKAIESIGDVYINPYSLRTGFADIIQAHISNFLFVSSKIEFSYFIMHASNDLFIKKGLYDYMKLYDACAGKWDISKEKVWPTAIGAQKDEELKSYMQKRNWKKIYGSQIEGSFYKKEVFQKICECILSFYNYETMPFVYVREECYFTTCLFNMIDNGESINVTDKGNITWFPVWRKDQNWTVRVRDVRKLLMDTNLYFNVKRVERAINDPTRAYIREFAGYLDVEAKIGLSSQPYSQINSCFRDLADFICFFLQVPKLKKLIRFFRNKIK